jgi:hypothetical protein
MLAVRVGTKLVVSVGLGLLAIAYAWVSAASVVTPYPEIVGQMIVLGTGMGLTSAPATESIMGAVSTAKAGVGSAVNDTTRELGGTLGVAVIGSVFASLYARALTDPATRALPPEAVSSARESIGGALISAQQLAEDGAPGAAATLQRLAERGFFDGLQTGCLVAAGVCAAGAILSARWLPAQPSATTAPAPARAAA